MIRKFGLTIIVSALLAPGVALGQSTWTGGAGNGNWSAAGNWNPAVVPTSSGTTAIILDGTVQTTTTQSIAIPFSLGSLTLGSGATNGFIVNGNALSFGGPAPTIVTTVAQATPAALRVNAPITFSANTLVDVQGNITAANAGAELILGGPLTAAAGTTVTMQGGTGAIVLLSGRNNSAFQGTLAFQAGSQTAVQLNNHNALGRGTVFNGAGANLAALRVGVNTAAAAADTGFNVQLAQIVNAGGTGATLAIGATGSGAATALVGFDNASTSFNGQVSLNTTTTRLAHFGKVGTGTLTLLANSSTGAGTYSVRDGTVILSGATGALSSASAEISIYAGATLTANNATNNSTNRLQAATNTGDRSISMSGGTLQLTGNAGANTTEQVTGLRLLSGQSTVLVDGTFTGRTHTLNFSQALLASGGGLAQSNSSTATAFFRSTNLGATAGDRGLVTFALAPTLTGGGGADGSTNISIIPFAFGTGATSAATVTTPESFVTYSATSNSVRSLTNAEYAAAFGAATNNVSLSALDTPGGAVTANALRLTTGGAVNIGANTLTITSGALLNNAGGDISGTGTVAFGTAGASTAFITTNGTMAIAPTVSATNLSKNGAGNLILNGPVNFTAAGGTLAVNAGAVTLGGTSSLNANVATIQVSRLAILDVVAPGLALGTGRTLTGAGTVQGSPVVNTGGTIAPSGLGGPGANLASPGTLTMGNLTLNGGSNYRWLVSSAITNGDNTVAATAGTLANYRSPYTSSLLTVAGTLDLNGASSANRVNLLITSLGLNNGAGALYDADFTVAGEPSRSWVIADATTITGFAANKFTFDTTGFTDGSGAVSGVFSISQVGNSLVLTYSPVPEPGMVLGLCAVGFGLVAGVRRARRPALAV